jgi:hypothetical protein
MGYCMTQEESKFFIAAENKANALEAMKSLPSKKYSWVEASEYMNTETLEEALEAWGFCADVDDDGSVVDIEFEWEKAGDEDVMLKAISDWVKPGSYIQMLGEDGARWRWKFTEDGFRKEYAEVVWEDDG